MSTDLILTIAHHLLIFTIAAIIAIEFAVVRPGIDPAQIRRVARFDLGYGIAAVLLVGIGFSRVYFGIKGPAFYLQNAVFWAKIAAFALVGLLSILPTLRLLAWRWLAERDRAFAPPAAEMTTVRRLLTIEACVFVLIPILAAAMARGYGLS
jgi:putative membrane protein